MLLLLAAMAVGPELPGYRAQLAAKMLAEGAKRTGAELERDVDSLIAVRTALEADNLDRAQVRRLKERLKRDPDDVLARWRLLARDGDGRACRKHALWFFERMPASVFASWPDVYCVYPHKMRRKAAAIWERHERSQDAAVLANAAAFRIMLREDERADALLERAVALEPDTVAWRERLGRQYLREAKRADGAERSLLLEKAELHLKRALELEVEPSWREMREKDLAEARALHVR